MKTDRLIGILSILLQQEKTTAPRLAEKFEVSRRTIGRDIDALCRAGIPICTSQGAGGGPNHEPVPAESAANPILKLFGGGTTK